MEIIYVNNKLNYIRTLNHDYRNKFQIGNKIYSYVSIKDQCSIT